MAEAYWHEKGQWVRGLPEEYFAVPGRVISLVGGGGKTSLMYHLAAAYQARGLRTAVMTSTKIYKPPVFCCEPAECRSCWKKGQYAVCGQEIPEEKMGPPSAKMQNWILDQADVILSEADGAKRMPCKVPAEHEPVLLPCTDRILGIMGLDAWGRKVKEVCFRPEKVCRLLGCVPDHRLTCGDMAEILLSCQGTRKSAGNREYYVVLNQCDDAGRLQAGKDIAALLEEMGHFRTVLTRLK